MSRIKLDLSEFKHVSSDDKSTKLQHKNGHTLILAHKSLSPDAQKQLGALSKIAQENRTQSQSNELQDQKMAYGGMYEEGGKVKIPPSDATVPDKDSNKEKPVGANVNTPSSLQEAWRRITHPMAEGGETKDPTRDEHGDVKPGYKAVAENSRANKPSEQAQTASSPSKMLENLKNAWADGGLIPNKKTLKPVETYKEEVHAPDTYGHLNEKAAELEEKEKPQELVESTDEQKMADGGEATTAQDAATDQEFNSSENTAKQSIPQEINSQANDLLSKPADIGNVQEKPQESDLAKHLAYITGRWGKEAVVNHLINPAIRGVTDLANTASNIGSGLIAGASGQPETPTTDQAKIQQAPPQQPPAPVVQPPAPLPQPNAKQIEETQQAAGTPTLQSDIANVNNPMGLATQGFANEIQAERAKATATQGLASGESNALAQDAAAKQRAFAKFQNTYDILSKERLAHIQDINNGHIDPNAYWKDHSKIATGLGMILAGFNPAGSPNAAIDFLKFQMDRNLDAQKANLNSKNNLLNANLQQFHNINAATEMTRLMQNDVITNQLNQAATEAKTPLAKAAAQAAIGQIQMESAQRFRQLAMTQSIMGLAAKGDPQSEEEFRAMTSMMRMLGMGEVAKDMESKRIPGIGTASREVPADVLKQISSSKAVNDLMNTSLEFSAQHRGLLDKLNPAEIAKAHTIQGQLIGAIKQAQHDGVYKPTEAEFLTSQIGGSPAAFFSKMSSEPKIRQLQTVKQQEMNELLSPYGIKAPQLPTQQQPQTVQGKDGRMYRRQGNYMVPVK